MGKTIRWSAESALKSKAGYYAKKAGWTVVKMAGERGIPDRMYLQDGCAVFIEWKLPGRVKLSARQELWLRRLRDAGFRAHACTSVWGPGGSMEVLEKALEEWQQSAGS